MSKTIDEIIKEFDQVSSDIFDKVAEGFGNLKKELEPKIKEIRDSLENNVGETPKDYKYLACENCRFQRQYLPLKNRLIEAERKNEQFAERIRIVSAMKPHKSGEVDSFNGSRGGWTRDETVEEFRNRIVEILNVK